MSGKRPKVRLEEAVVVSILTERDPADPYRLVDDDGTIAAFQEWSFDERIYPLAAGGGISGPGLFVHTYDVEHRPAIRQWFLDRGYQSDLEPVEPEPGHIIGCTSCEATVELPADPDRPGYVLIAPMDGWSAPPVRCPVCSTIRQ